MKTNKLIRTGTFETNSSSCHTLSVAGGLGKENWEVKSSVFSSLGINDNLNINLDEYCSGDYYLYSWQDKLSYVFSNDIAYNKSLANVVKYLHKTFEIEWLSFNKSGDLYYKDLINYYENINEIERIISQYKQDNNINEYSLSFLDSNEHCNALIQLDTNFDLSECLYIFKILNNNIDYCNVDHQSTDIAFYLADNPELIFNPECIIVLGHDSNINDIYAPADHILKLMEIAGLTKEQVFEYAVENLWLADDVNSFNEMNDYKKLEAISQLSKSDEIKVIQC